MNQDEYLTAMRLCPCGNPLPLDQTPASWFAEAWQIDPVRKEQTADMVRTVRKMGDLHYTREFLGLLGRSLSTSQLVELYVAIRDQSGREPEFRAAFEQAFPEVIAELPPPIALAHWDFRKEMYAAITDRNLPRIKMLLRYMREREIPIASVRFTEYEVMPPEEVQAKSEEAIEQYIEMIQSPPASVRKFSAREYAESLGAADVASILIQEAESGGTIGEQLIREAVTCMSLIVPPDQWGRYVDDVRCMTDAGVNLWDAAEECAAEYKHAESDDLTRE